MQAVDCDVCTFLVVILIDKDYDKAYDEGGARSTSNIQPMRPRPYHFR
jgi:hypothetical protein